MQEPNASESVSPELADTEQLEQAEQQQQQQQQQEQTNTSTDVLAGVDLGDLAELVSELGKGAVDLVSSVFDHIDLNF